MRARSLAVLLLVLAGLPHVCSQRRRGGTGPFLPSCSGTAQLLPLVVTARSQEQQERAVPCPRISRLTCVTFVTGPPAQSHDLAMPDSGVERQTSLLGEKESAAIFFNLHKLQSPE